MVGTSFIYVSSYTFWPLYGGRYIFYGISFIYGF